MAALKQFLVLLQHLQRNGPVVLSLHVSTATSYRCAQGQLRPASYAERATVAKNLEQESNQGGRVTCHSVQATRRRWKLHCDATRLMESF